MSETGDSHDDHPIASADADDPATPAATTHVPDEHGQSHTVVGVHGSTADHGEGHGHDDHGHAAGALGPIDWTMWAIGVLGVVVGLMVTAGLVLATGFAFNA